MVRRTSIVFGALLSALFLAPPALLAQPPNDNCFSAMFVVEGTFPFDNIGAVQDGPAPCGAMGADIWFQYMPSQSGAATLNTCGSSYDTVLAAYDPLFGCPPPPGSLPIACNDDSCGLSSSISIPVVAGSLVLVQLGGFGGDVGNGTLTISVAGTTVVNDQCSTATAVGEGVFGFADIGAFLDGPVDCDNNLTGDVWFLYFPSAAGTATIDTCATTGTLIDTTMIVYDAALGCPVPGSPCVASDDDSCGSIGFNSSVTLSVAPGVAYLVQLGGWNGSTGDGTLTISLASTPSPIFLRGDADGDGCVNALDDCVFALSVLFPSGPPPSFTCLDSADMNDDGLLNISDAITILAWGFPPGAPLVIAPPGPFVCGPDPTADSLDCASYVCAPCTPPPPDPNVVLSLLAGPAPAVGPVSAQVLLDTDQPLAGLSFGVCHSAQVVGPSFVNQGPALAALNGGGGPAFFQVGVFPGQGWTVGIVVNFFGTDTIPPGVGAPIIDTQYSCTGAGAATLAFCDNLGNPPVPISATAPGGVSVTPTTLGTTVACGPPPPGSFVRGDISGDGVLDASDAAALEQFLFPGILPFGPPPEPLGCDLVPNQSGDINDNEVETIADLLMFLEYLNCGGISIPGPSTCGDDPDDADEGFGTIDNCYMVSAYTISVTGAFDEERDVDILLRFRAPETIRAVSFGLLLGSALSLDVADPLTVAPGIFADFSGVLVDGDFIVVGAGSTTCGTPMIALPDLVCPPTFPTFVTLGTLHLKLAPNAIFPPIELVQEGVVDGHIRRTTIVDMFFDDHQPYFLSGEAERFARGNANNFDSLVDIADPIYILGHLFPAPTSLPLLCRDAADANNDGAVDIADPIYILGFLFASGTQPPSPFPECGFDQDIDQIDLDYPPELRCEDPLCL